MRIVLVTSSATYVKDNYYHLINVLTDPDRLPENVETVALFLMKTHTPALFFKCIGLYLIGVKGISSILVKNMLRTKFNDPRIKLAKERNIPVFRFDNINKKSAGKALASLNPDLVINLRTRNIYKKKILKIPKTGCINVHHGILPNERGAFCDLWAWFEKRPVGFSIHWMNRKIDDGKIIRTEKINAAEIKEYVEIPYKSSIIEAEVMLEVIGQILRKGKDVGYENRCNAPVYRKNPTTDEIRAMLKKGIKL